MSIATLSDLRSGLRETLLFRKTQLDNSGTGAWYSYWISPSLPASGGAVGNTTTGLVPTSGTGSPTINFGSGNGYLAAIEYQANIAGRYMLVDRLFHVGPIVQNTTATLSSQPSYSSRVPGGTDFTGLLLHAESTGSGSGNTTLTVTYTNQSGVTGRSTSRSFNTAELAYGLFLPLAAGDTGVQKIESVQSVAVTSSYNVTVLRPLWRGRAAMANTVYRHDFDRIALPQIWQSSCLCLLFQPDVATTIGLEVLAEIVSG